MTGDATLSLRQRSAVPGIIGRVIAASCEPIAKNVAGLAIASLFPVLFITYREWIVDGMPEMSRKLCRESRAFYVFFLIVVPLIIGIGGWTVIVYSAVTC